MNVSVAASYRACQRLARRTASNFYYPFVLLPQAKRQAMCALYAFLRQTDDLGDSQLPVEARRAALAAWRDALDAALAGEHRNVYFPALADTVAQFDIPPKYLHQAIDGMEMDLEVRQYETFDDLRQYCYCVASTVGLACIHIWGFRSEAALLPAEQAGVAFQLTNILRDLTEDADRGRVYLPQEDLRRFGYRPEELQQRVYDDRFRRLMQFQIERAEQLYEASRELELWLHRDGVGIFRAMSGIYRALLDEMRRRRGDVFSTRVRLTTARKIWIAARCMAKPAVERCFAGAMGR